MVGTGEFALQRGPAGSAGPRAAKNVREIPRDEGAPASPGRSTLRTLDNGELHRRHRPSASPNRRCDSTVPGDRNPARPRTQAQRSSRRASMHDNHAYGKTRSGGRISGRKPTLPGAFEAGRYSFAPWLLRKGAGSRRSWAATVRSVRWRGARASGFRRRRPFRPRRAPSGDGRASSGCGSR